MKKGKKGGSQQQSKKGCKKSGRNREKCTAYKAKRHALNKLLKIVAELEKNPGNDSARKALERYRAELNL